MGPVLRGAADMKTEAVLRGFWTVVDWQQPRKAQRRENGSGHGFLVTWPTSNSLSGRIKELVTSPSGPLPVVVVVGHRDRYSLHALS